MILSYPPLSAHINTLYSRGVFGSANNAFVCIQSLHLRIPPRVLHFSAIHFPNVFISGACTNSLNGYGIRRRICLFTRMIMDIIKTLEKNPEVLKEVQTPHTQTQECLSDVCM